MPQKHSQMVNTKVVYIFCFLMLLQNVAAQQSQQKDSITYLSEVVVNPKDGPRAVMVKTKGRGNETVGFYENEQFVSLLRNVPNCQLLKVSFFFNPHILPKQYEGEFKLLLFERNEFGKPGKPIAMPEVRFVVSSASKKKITIDLSALNVIIEGDVFFGFETLHLKMGVFITEMKENRSAISYARTSKTDWFKPVREMPIQLKMELETLPVR